MAEEPAKKTREPTQLHLLQRVNVESIVEGLTDTQLDAFGKHAMYEQVPKAPVFNSPKAAKDWLEKAKIAGHFILVRNAAEWNAAEKTTLVIS